jgi:hypothetical protein
MKRKVIPVVILVIVAAAAYWFYSRRHQQAEGAIEASGTVEATEAVLGFATGGASPKCWFGKAIASPRASPRASRHPRNHSAAPQAGRVDAAGFAAEWSTEPGLKKLASPRGWKVPTPPDGCETDCSGPRGWLRAKWFPNSSWIRAQ